jgi:tetratricopeptide (TPR) repeat protein
MNKVLDTVRSRSMTRLSVIVLCCALYLVPVVRAQSAMGGPRTRNRPDVHLQRIAEPPELAGEPGPIPKPPTPASLQFVQSKAISAANPHDVKTLPPAIREVTGLIRLEPTNSDFYLLRATLSCYVRANSTEILDDISRSMSLHEQSASSAYPTLRDHYALKAKIEFESGHFEDSVRDLDAAIRENYEDAKDVFNDGNTKPTTTAQPCVWTLADLDTLERRFPQDYRPPLYRGLYLTFFYSFDLESDYGPVLGAFHRAAVLNPAAPLPEFFIGELYSVGRLGGMMSVKNAQCVESVVPRTPQCLALDEVQRTGVRSLTRAIALDPKFGPAYALRAIASSKLKEYRQAIRDYDKVLELTPASNTARISYNDRGLAKVSLGDYQSAVLDFTQSIAMGCKESCGSYDNRADVYIKLHNYPKAIEDISASIKQTLSYAVFLMNIDQFRRIYPEYDAVPDDALCEKLRALFFPAMQYADFAKQFLIEAKDFKSTVLPELYMKRGDAYESLKQTAKANIEYDRVSHAFPEWAALSFVDKNGKRIRKPQ